MTIANDTITSTDIWSATDFPVRNVHRAAFLIDGRMTMLEMSLRFLRAKHTIYIASWGLSPDLLLVRGQHHRAGPDGSPEQEKLLHWLRDKQLTEEDLVFWQKSEVLSVETILGHMVSKGVDVRVLLWDAITLPFKKGPKQVKEELAAVGVQCLLDDSHLTLNHPIASLHQKAIVIDGEVAFVGGIDLMYEEDGEFDRWDTKGHAYNNSLRKRKNGMLAHCWHDMHLTFEGSSVIDVKTNFCQRWNAVITRKGIEPEHLLSLPSLQDVQMAIAQEKEKEAIPFQVLRTIPRATYDFTPDEGISAILDVYQKAFASAQYYIYIENQYFWRRTYLGLETPLLGLPTEVMQQLWQSLADALKRGVIVSMILPDNPNVGRDFTDDGLNYLCELAPEAVASGTLQIYTLGSSLCKDEKLYYRPIYVHAKLAIVDDQLVTIGSANLNNRGMRDDAEINVLLRHPAMARGLRMLLMAEHLGLVDEDTLFRFVETMGCSDPTAHLRAMDTQLQHAWQHLQALLGDPLQGFKRFAQQASKNMAAIQNQHILEGHLVPYIRQNMAQEFNVEVNAVNGWLSRLNREELPPDACDIQEVQAQNTEISAT